jgi:hypothetical protein
MKDEGCGTQLKNLAFSHPLSLILHPVAEQSPTFASPLAPIHQER